MSRFAIVMGIAVLLGAAGAPWAITTSAAQATARSSCLPDVRPMAAPALVPTPGLNAGDAAYQLAIAADPGPISSTTNTATAGIAVAELARRVGTAHRAYQNEAASRPTLTSAAYTRLGDLQDLLATRGRELVAAEHHWSFDEPRLGPDVCHLYCVAATSYARALRADRSNPRADAQLTTYGPAYAEVTLRTCPE